MNEFNQGIQDAATAGAEIFVIGGEMLEVAKYVQERAPDYVIDRGHEHEFILSAYLEIAKKTLWDEDADPHKTLQLLVYLNYDTKRADEIVEIGKGLIGDERFVYRGQRVLSRAVDMYRGAYRLSRDYGSESPRDRALFLTGNYFDVIGLQVESGDAAEARRTTLGIAPHLIEVADELDDTTDSDVRAKLDAKLSYAAIYLGDLAIHTVQQLVRKIQDEQIRNATTQALVERFSKNLLASGQVDDALGVLLARGLQPHGLWEEAAVVLAEGDAATVQALADKIDQQSPGYYSECDEQLISQTPILEVLVATQKDVFIGDAFRSLLMEDVGAALGWIQRFAYSCGLEDNITRLQMMTDRLTLDKQQKNTVHDAFQEGLDNFSEQE